MGIPLDQIGFDIDGVVADTMSLFLHLAQTRFDFHHWKYEDITDYDLTVSLGVEPEQLRPITLLVLDEPHLLGLKPLAGAVDTLTRFSRLAPLMFVTARRDCVPIYAWILQTLQKVDPFTVHLETTGSPEKKPMVLRELGLRFFVEDRLETCFLLADSGITPIVFDQPWNRREHPFQRVGNWEELNDLLSV